MNSKLTIFITALLLSVWSFSVDAQTTVPKGKAQLIEFTNATAKFTVPEGKTWTVHSAFMAYPSDNNQYSIVIKSINGVILTDLSKNIVGKFIFHSNLLANLNLPLVFPEKTVFELIIIKKEGETRSLYDKNAFLNLTETEN
jgi:predicted nucleotidyltransferase component of viral defense system